MAEANPELEKLHVTVMWNPIKEETVKKSYCCEQFKSNCHDDKVHGLTKSGKNSPNPNRNPSRNLSRKRNRNREGGTRKQYPSL